MGLAFNRVRWHRFVRKPQSFVVGPTSLANRGYRSAKSALADQVFPFASCHYVQLTNSKCFVYASLMVDRLPSAVMSFDDYPKTNRQGTSHAKWIRRRPEAFAGLAGVIGLAVLVSIPVCGASLGHGMCAKRVGSSADSSRLPASEIPQNQAVWNVHYTVRLKLDTGDEQSVTVVAPPGGLQLVMRDMTGDQVPNDVVVTPALLHWPLTVLVNDGHRFTVAISGSFPDSASDRDRASSQPGAWEISALLAKNCETHAASTRRAGVPPPQSEGFLSPVVATITASSSVGSGSGRAPPSLLPNS